MSEAGIGVDVGSTSWKGVVVDADGDIVFDVIEETHPLLRAQSERLIGLLRQNAPSGTKVVATGYGRKGTQADAVQTEISCHARGAWHQVRKPMILVDIGGQDTKVILIGSQGSIDDFRMNDKCAAGTGRFLEVTLQRLQIDRQSVQSYASMPDAPAEISSTCAVFAESEVVSLVANEVPLPSIVKGVHDSLARRVIQLLGPVPPGRVLCMSGGVALNSLLVESVSKALGIPVTPLPRPQLVGALGAALAAMRL